MRADVYRTLVGNWRAYHHLDRNREALKVLSDAVPAGRENCTIMRKRYPDFRGSIPALLPLRGNVRLRLGRIDAGLASASEAITAPFGNDLHTAPRVAARRNELNHPREGLELLKISFRSDDDCDVSAVCALGGAGLLKGKGVRVAMVRVGRSLSYDLNASRSRATGSFPEQPE